MAFGESDDEVYEDLALVILSSLATATSCASAPAAAALVGEGSYEGQSEEPPVLSSVMAVSGVAEEAREHQRSMRAVVVDWIPFVCRKLAGVAVGNARLRWSLDLPLGVGERLSSRGPCN